MERYSAFYRCTPNCKVPFISLVNMKYSNSLVTAEISLLKGNSIKFLELELHGVQVATASYEIEGKYA